MRYTPPPAALGPTPEGVVVEVPADGSVADPLQALVAGALRGEREALAQLLSIIAPSIVSAIKVVAGPDLDVEDAAQEAMMAIADAVGRFRGRCTFLHYARRIAVRTTLGMRRARREKVRRLVAIDTAGPGEPPAAESDAP